jgi:hypothetical protein
MSSPETAMPPTPRKLSTHQKAVLIHVLVAFPGQKVTVFYSRDATDALAYARDFVTIFKSIEWNVNDPEPVEIAIPQSSGLAFIVSRMPGLPTGAEALRDTLRIYGIEVATVCDSARNIASGAFILAVGRAM